MKPWKSWLGRARRDLVATAVTCLLFVATPVVAGSPVRSLLNQGRLEDAIPLCRQFEVLSTTNEDNFFACGWVYFRSDQMGAGEKILERMRRRFTQPEYQLLLGYDYFKKKDYDEAKRVYDAIASKYRRKPAGLSAQELTGELYEAQGQLDTAAFVYRQVVSDDPNRPIAQWGLGRYYLTHGDNSRARQHLEEVARLWPRHAASRVSLANLYLKIGDIADSAHWLAEAYRLNRNDSQVLDQMGLLYEKKGNVGQAVKLWQRALELKKDDKIAKDKLSSYLLYMVDQLIDAHDFKKALAKLDTSGKVLANEPELLLRRGIIYRNLGTLHHDKDQVQKAAGDLLAYVNKRPKDGNARRELGICYVNLNQDAEALDNFSRAMELDPQNGINYAWLAYVLESKGKLIDAKEAWRKALELMKDPKDLERANRRLAAIEEELNADNAKREKEKSEKSGQ